MDVYALRPHPLADLFVIESNAIEGECVQVLVDITGGVEFKVKEKRAKKAKCKGNPINTERYAD